jgi:HK97 family phage major capsid protein
MGFENITLLPKAISSNMQYSKVLLMEGNPSIDSLVRDDMIATLALAIDLAALHGTGTLQPVGLAGTTGINTVALAPNGQALGNATAYPALVSLESAVAANNGDVSSFAFLMRPSHRGSLRGVPQFANTNTPVWDGTNKVVGYRAEVTNQLATNLTCGTSTTVCSILWGGCWSEMLVASFGHLDLCVDPFSAGASGIIRLYAILWDDIGIRNPASFCALGGIL